MIMGVNKVKYTIKKKILKKKRRKQKARKGMPFFVVTLVIAGPGQHLYSTSRIC